MACSMQRLCLDLNRKLFLNLIIPIRHGHHLRGKPPGIARSIQQRLDELNYKDPEVTFRVDIGLPPLVIDKSKHLQERLEVLKKQKSSPEIEKKARNKELIIELSDVNTEWAKYSAAKHIKEIADHFGIFEHLFGDAYFYPTVPLSIAYVSNDVEHPVYFGNIIKPAEASQKPKVDYKTDDNSLWTLILTNPDGNFTDQGKEYVHWFVGNIPGNNLDKGETIVEYLQPFPPKGTGYHRHVFVLYKQEKKLNFSSFKKDGACLDLKDRSFSTLDFYRERQDDLTPGGLSFFQADWDKSLTQFYHQKLEMKEPIFEYDFPAPYIRPQEWFPLRKPFNLYMDKYRDPMQINKEHLVRKLKDVHPFRAPPAPLQFPNAVFFEGYMPSWLKLEKRKSRMKWGRVNDIE